MMCMSYDLNLKKRFYLCVFLTSTCSQILLLYRTVFALRKRHACTRKHALTGTHTHILAHTHTLSAQINLWKIGGCVALSVSAHKVGDLPSTQAQQDLSYCLLFATLSTNQQSANKEHSAVSNVTGENWNPSIHHTTSIQFPIIC